MLKIGLSVGVCCALASGHALAQSGPAVAAMSTTDALAKASSPDNRAANDGAAARAYHQALAAYSRGDLEDALQKMQHSYALSNRAELLFNLGRLERELKHCRAALQHFEGYLRGVPEGELRGDALRATEALGRECAPEPAAPPPEPLPSVALTAAPIAVAEPPVPAPIETASARPPAAALPAVVQPVDAPYWTTTRVIGWSTVATGVVSGGLALYFLSAAVADHNEAAEIVGRYKYRPADEPWRDAQESQHRNARAAQALGVTAGVLVVSGAVLLLFSPKTEAAPRASASVALHPGYVGAVYSGNF